MSSERHTVIRLQGVGKKYRIRHQYAAPYTTLRDAVGETLRGLGSRLRGKGRPGRNTKEDFWALRDISLEIKQGDRLGIIGRNGAGKSTLLKLLSRITAPSQGRILLKGRVASLLEVGTGFHPELTGRENIYLNGAIMGMRRVEITRKFDEIVAFAEIDKFLDTPVKRYSSGMYVRLAFAVAAHLETEILLVDEVLAVGDAAFQKKSLGKMGDLKNQDRTIVFVSHNMPAIMRVCNKAALLDQGRLVMFGNAGEVISRYLQSDLGTSAVRVWDQASLAPGDDRVRLHAVRVHTKAGEIADTVDVRQPVGIDIEYWNFKENLRLVPNLHFYNEGGVCIFISTNTKDAKWYNQPHPIGFFKSTCWIPANFLADGLITVTAAVSTINPTEACAVEREAVSFMVEDSSEGDGARGQIATNFYGVVRPLLEWQMEYRPGSIPPLEK
jgi:lipopolysaccharide transport system ATP-binding protein